MYPSPHYNRKFSLTSGNRKIAIFKRKPKGKFEFEKGYRFECQFLFLLLQVKIAPIFSRMDLPAKLLNLNVGVSRKSPAGQEKNNFTSASYPAQSSLLVKLSGQTLALMGISCSGQDHLSTMVLLRLSTI
jgi:hypothetical protein